MSKLKLSASALAIIAAVPALGFASTALAQTATVDQNVEAVIVTGTRLTGFGPSTAPRRSRCSTPAP